MNLDKVISTDDTIVLMSIHEEYYDAIMKGTKQFEFRTRYPNKPTKILVYVSKTKKSICALLDCDRPLIGTAQQLHKWIDAPLELAEYFGDNRTGCAIPIQKRYLIPELSLADLKNNLAQFTAPQAYSYVQYDSPLLDLLRKQGKLSFMEE